MIPGDGFLPAMVPASFDAWITCLSRFGTMTLFQVVQPAVRLAEDGFPVYHRLQRNIRQHAERYSKEWPTTARIFLPAGGVPDVGQVLRQSDLANTLRGLVNAEKSRGNDRETALTAARDLFYRGEIARKIVDFATTHQSKDASGKPHTSLLGLGDFAQYGTRGGGPGHVGYEG